ncbi:MAG: Gfo/Idh/MocA family oxidoreductase [Sphingobacteriales bacterium]|jgi:predicted dehydrogenase
MRSRKSISRRTFIRDTATTLGGFIILPRHVLGKGYVPPSDKLTKAIIGVGGMGMNHVPYGDTPVIAVCDVNKKHLDAAVEKIGNGVKATKDFREVLAMKDVDIVHIATPPHWHGIMAVEAAKAGKDIWCEKPMTRTIGEGRKVQEAVKKYGRIFRLNTWFRFEEDFYGMKTTVKPIKKLVQSGLLGWPLKVTISKHTGFDWKFYWIGRTDLEPQQVPDYIDYDFWLGPAPHKPFHMHRVEPTFRGYWDYDGGGLGDMGQHYIDPVQYFLGKDDTSPVLVEVEADRQDKDAVGTFRRIVYTYEDGCKIILDGDGRDVGAAYIEGPKGKLYPEFKSDIPNLEKKLQEFPDPAPQVTDFITAVKERKTFALNEVNGHRSCTIVNMGKIAMQLNRNLSFNPKTQRFINDDEANALAYPEMKGIWKI